MRKYIKPRKILTYVLSVLASLAISKHKIRVCVVVGTSGSSIVKEMLYTVLKERSNVRRNVEDIWWDLSIPLNVLGYEDKQRSYPEWISLIASAIVAILKNKSNPHLLILNADTKHKETADYWSNFLSPEYLVILNFDKESILANELLEKNHEVNGQIVSPHTLLADIPKEYNEDRVFTYGTQKSDLLLKRLTDGRLRVTYKKEKIVLPKKLWPSVSVRITGAIFSVAVLEGFDLSSTAYACLKYTFPKSMLGKIRNNLLKSSINV